MTDIQRVHRTDSYLEISFSDDSVRCIDLARHLDLPVPKTTVKEPVLRLISIRPDNKTIIWDDGTEITADFLYTNSQLIGWVDKTWGENSYAWQPLIFKTALIKIDFSNNDVHASLLLDGKPFPALRFSSVMFGIYENCPWYHVPFPGDDGVYEPEWEEPQIVFDTLDQLVQLVHHAKEAKLVESIDITGYLQKTGYDFWVAPMSPRSAAICADRFKRISAHTK